MQRSSKKISFNRYHLEVICELTLRGWSLRKISKLENMPPIGIIYSWTKKFKCLKQAVLSCKKSRNDFKEDTFIDDLVQKIYRK